MESWNPIWSLMGRMLSYTSTIFKLHLSNDKKRLPWLFIGYMDVSGQIIATSHDLTPNGRVVGEPCLKWPYFREIQVGEIL